MKLLVYLSESNSLLLKAYGILPATEREALICCSNQAAEPLRAQACPTGLFEDKLLCGRSGWHGRPSQVSALSLKSVSSELAVGIYRKNRVLPGPWMRSTDIFRSKRDRHSV